MAKQGLVNSVNEIRTMASSQYQSVVPILNTDSGIENLSTPLLQYPNLMNEFINALVQKISYTQLETKLFNNPLRILEGDNIPLGAIGEEIYINPANGREYDINDFAGLLEKYEADVKVQYQTINLDEQFPVTIIRQKLKQAFISWNTLEDFITNITTSLYNGCYIRQFNVTKALVSNAYRENSVQIEQITAPTTKELAEEFIKKARTLYLNFQSPSSAYNAWNKVGGYGREIITWSNKEDIVFLIRNDIQSELDVSVLAKAFNVDSTSLLGKIIPINDFNIYDRKNNLVYDGSKIIGIMCDKSWFRIKLQDMYMEDFRNANNRSIQFYLNLIKMFRYSLFANAVVFATEIPQINASTISFNQQDVKIDHNVSDEVTLTITTNPAQANGDVTFKQTMDDTNVQVTKIDNRSCTVKGMKNGSGTIEATMGSTKGSVNYTTSNFES